MNVHEYPLNLSLGLLPIKQHGILGIISCFSSLWDRFAIMILLMTKT